MVGRGIAEPWLPALPRQLPSLSYETGSGADLE